MLNDKVVLLTGAAGGIGQAITRRMLDAGATVIASDLSSEALARLRSDHQGNSRLHTIVADVSSEEGGETIAAGVKSATGHLDILINGAGLFPPCPFEDMTFKEWRRILSVNLDSMFLVTHAALPLMKERGWGRVINFGSNSVFQGTANYSHYVAAKAGVIGFTRSLAREIGRYNITANVVAPGLTSTPVVLKSASDDFLENRRLQRAIPRHQQAEDLTGVVMFLSSPDSDFMTGQVLNVDGGAIFY